MSRIFQYYGQFQSVRGNVGVLPGWARGVLAVLAIPGIVLIALSFLALGVSIAALLLLTVPAYRLLKAAVGTSGQPGRDRETVEGVIVEPARAYDQPAQPGAVRPPDVFIGDVVDEPARPSGDGAGRRTIDVRIVE